MVATSDGDAAAADDPPPQVGRVRRTWDSVRWPPPHEGQLFTRRGQAAGYLGAWGLTSAHIVIWVLIAVGVLHGLGFKVGNSVLSFVATCLLVWVVIATHRRLQIDHGGRTRHVLAAWWMGPWDAVGRVVWLPVRLPTAARTVLRGPESAEPAHPGDELVPPRGGSAPSGEHER